ncbi:3-oxoacyl-[acyl-carrier-protein] synthase III C-terminal domain-containing protein [Streptomyces sp. M10(2022)]
MLPCCRAARSRARACGTRSWSVTAPAGRRSPSTRPTAGSGAAASWSPSRPAPTPTWPSGCWPARARRWTRSTGWCPTRDRPAAHGRTRAAGHRRERFVTNYETRANTGSASVPIVLSEMSREGRLRAGDLCYTPTVGSGWYYGGCSSVSEHLSAASPADASGTPRPPWSPEAAEASVRPWPAIWPPWAGTP